jgi:hypothetical protein
VNSRAVAFMMAEFAQRRMAHPVSFTRYPTEPVSTRWSPTVGQQLANWDAMGLLSTWSLQGQSKQDILLRNWSRD